MAIQLPKYQKQVGVSGATTEQLIDPDVAAAPLRAATQAIGAVTDMGMEFASKLRQHKDEGDIAGYRNRANQLDDAVKLATEQGRLRGYKGDELFEKSITPVLEKFESDINNSDYSKDVKDIAYADFNVRANSVYSGFKADQLKEAVELANLEKISLATDLESRGMIDQITHLLFLFLGLNL